MGNAHCRTRSMVRKLKNKKNEKHKLVREIWQEKLKNV